MKETKISVLCAQMLTTAMLLTSVGLAIPRLGEDVGLTLAMRGNIISSQYLGATLAVLIGGILCDKYGKMFITKIFMLAAALVSVFFGTAWDYASAITAAFLLGAVCLIMENSIMSQGLDLGEKSRIGNSLIQTSFSVGAILIPLAYLACMQFGLWRPVYYGMAALFVIGFFISKGPVQRAEGQTFVNMLVRYASFFKKPSYLIGPAFVFLYVAAEIGLWSFAPTFFESAGYGSLSGIISAVLIWAMMLIGRIVSTALIRKISIMSVLISFGLCGVVAYASIMIFDGGAALLCTAITGFMFAPFYALLTSFSTEFAKDNSSSYLAFTMGVGSLGPTLLGSTGGAVGQAIGARFVILPALICFILLVTGLIIFTTVKSVSASREYI